MYTNLVKIRTLCRGDYFGSRCLMLSEEDVKGKNYLANNFNYPSKVTVVCDT